MGCPPTTYPPAYSIPPTVTQVETILGPLQYGYSAYKSGLQAVILELTAQGGTRETVGPSLRAIATQIEADATAAEKQAGRGDEKLRASAASTLRT